MSEEGVSTTKHFVANDQQEQQQQQQQQHRSAKSVEQSKSIKNPKTTYSKPKVDITKEEFDRIKVALEKQEFRKLFLDYIEEIQDPENRKRYEDEIKQFEAERGVEVTFIHPEPGFVIKTSQDGDLKCFINCAQCSKIDKPSNQFHEDSATGTCGMRWSLPLAQGPPTEDIDNNKRRCMVYDVVFHPDTLHLAKKNKAIHQCVVDTALDAVEKQFHVKLDRVNIKFPKMQFKGIARPTVIRKLAKNPPPETDEPHPLEDLYPPKPTADAGKPKILPIKQTNLNNDVTADKKVDYCVPKYTIKHRKAVDMSEYTNELDAKLNATIPSALIVEIELPLLNSSGDCQLDVTNRTIFLVSERIGARYHLILDLPYVVNDKEGYARFDTDTRRLSITLPVLQKDVQQQRDMHNMLLHLGPEDSGVESDIREDLSSNTTAGSPIEELELDLADDSLQVCNYNKDMEQSSENIENDEISVQQKQQQQQQQQQQAFLNPKIDYQLPSKFDCNTLDNTMSWVISVKNVQTDSLQIQRSARHLHFQFASIGSGYYPIHYAFYVQLPFENHNDDDDRDDDDDLIEIVDADAEAWENNVVLNIHLNSCSENICSYLAGLDKDNLKAYKVQAKFQVAHHSRLRKKENDLPPKTPVELDVTVQHLNNDETIEVEVKAPVVDDIDACGTDAKSSGPIEAAKTEETTDTKLLCDQTQIYENKINKKSNRKEKNRRSLSESACDDIKAYQQQQQQQDEQQQQQKQQQQQHKTTTLVAGDSVSDTSEINNTAKETSTKLMQNTIKSIFATSASVNVPVKNAYAGVAGTKAAQQRLQRSFSESRGSIICGSVNSISYKGILKHYSHYDTRPSISDSCSSIDDYSSNYSTSADGASSNVGSLRFSHSFSDIPEENVAAITRFAEGNKKTVRFSEVIKKQVFRLDSSILGQRKKNQKRRNHRKLRALQRRHSEGDSIDCVENKSTITTAPIHLVDNNANNQATQLKNKSNKKKQNGCNSSNGAQNPTKNYRNGNGKNSKVNGKSYKARCSHDSESSSDMDANKNTLIFHMDM